MTRARNRAVADCSRTSLRSSKRYYQAFENANLPRIREGLGVARNSDELSNEVTSFATQHDSDVAQTIEEILRAPTQRSFKLGGTPGLTPFRYLPVC